jgi:GNAT superfamily N-acetyltransferase
MKQIIQVKELSQFQKEEILLLWNNEYPKGVMYSGLSSFEEYLKALNDAVHLIIVNDTGNVLGWCFDFIRDSERWFAMILKNEIHGQGWGSKLLNVAKTRNQVLNGWVIDHDRYEKTNGGNYRSPLNFYIKNGFEVISNERLELEHLSAVKVSWSNKYE